MTVELLSNNYLHKLINPEIHDILTFGEDSVTPKVHQNGCVDVRAFVVEYFATDYFTPTWHRILMFGQKFIIGILEWLRVPNFLRNDGPPWNFNLLSTYADWGERRSSTSMKMGIGYEGYYNSVYIN